MSVIASLLLVSTATAQPLTLYIAPEGNDAWSGRLPAPNATRSDGPLASLTGARDALRKVRATPTPLGPVTVQIHGGNYRLDAPFVLQPQDSGTPSTPVVFEASPGQRPIFSGGRLISGFKQNGNLWEAQIPQVKAGQWYFRQLFVNGQRRQLARSPNTGYHRIAKLLPGPPDPRAKPIDRQRFVFAPNDVKPFARLSDACIVLMHSWEVSIHPIKSVDPATNTVQFSAPLKEWWTIGFWEPAQRYYVENALELLDSPGEWYLNRETGILSYWPMPGEQIDKTEVVAPFLDEFVRLAGDPDRNQFVQHVTIKGLAFHHADWKLDPKGNSSTQAAVEVPAVITADGAINCAIERCEVAHIGTYGIWFRRGCKDDRIQQNRLFDLGAGGIRVGEASMAKTDVAESTRILVDNNHIFTGGRVYASAIGIWLAQASHNQISHNDIHDMLYSGISVGWNWGLEPNRTHHNIIEHNHVHNISQNTLSDSGLIYCLGVSPGSVIRNNVFHDNWPYSTPALGWGIYLDAQCGDFTVENNLVYNTLSGGLMFNNGGHQHVIQNNIFALSANEALWPYSEKRPSTFRRNIIYLTQGALLVPHGERSLKERLEKKESPGDWNDNLYWHPTAADELRFYSRGFSDWQALGLDTRSRIADPLFENPTAHNFALKSDSPALALGFKPLDISKVGLYGDAAWVAESRHADCRPVPLPAPPAPLTFVDDFDKSPLAAHPANAHVSGEEDRASIRISDERALSGRQSLKIADAKSLKASWQPHFYYQPHLTKGIVRQSFDAWLAPEAQFSTEWRDSSIYPRNIGPSVRFDGSGKVTAAGKTLAQFPPQTWLHVEIEATLGKNTPRTFKLTVTPAGGQPRTFDDLPIPGEGFRQLHWLGFSSTAASDTAFFLDNLALQQPNASPARP